MSLKRNVSFLLFFVFITSCPVFSQQSETVIPYKEIGNVGLNKTITISKDLKTRDNLIILSNQLENQFKNDRYAYVHVYDDEKAAKYYEKITTLSDAESKFYDDHYIAVYWKTPDARHDFTIMLNGLNGEAETIKYESKTEASSTKQTEGILALLPIFMIAGIVYIIVNRKKTNKRFSTGQQIIILIGGFFLISFIGNIVSEGSKILATVIPIFFVIVIILAIFWKKISKNPKKNTVDEEREARKKALEEGADLPVVSNSYVLLHKGEVCHFSENAEYVKTKNVVVGYEGRRGGATTRLVKGLYLHSGASQSRAIRADIQESSSGIFSVTNKRIIFSGQKWSFDEKIENLSAISPFSDGLGFQFGTKQYSILLDDSEYVYAIIARIINDADVESEEK